MRIFKEQFGQRLVQALKAKGINQRQLSEILNVSPPTVSRWKTGEDFPNEDRLPDICKALGVEPSFFIEPVYIPDSSEIKKAIQTVSDRKVEYGAQANSDISDIKEMLKDLGSAQSIQLIAEQEAHQKAIKEIEELRVKNAELEQELEDYKNKVSVLEYKMLKLRSDQLKELKKTKTTSKKDKKRA